MDLVTQPVAGTVRIGDRSPNEFRGWVELFAMLEDAGARARPHAAELVADVRDTSGGHDRTG